MVYDIKIYETNSDNSARFSLGTIGTKPLFVFGLNPSTADNRVPDKTIKKVMKFALIGGYDSFIMLNLYAQRTPKPDKIHHIMNCTLHYKNIEKVIRTLQTVKNPTVLASWGQTIKIRPFLFDCLKDIYEATITQKIEWIKIGELTTGKHPRHPSRAPYKFGFTKFDINEYLRND